ncbi:hypothetical protein [Budvicia aquatica]|uniref:Uncharacterized protein n=1 Tax=Budvicia aquatica TaxID=82979 RepID=A0A2C6CZW9_9GAMM|nr:hypothetical protein [Budvicia aquatica]PHI32239.1 hypothetical protein CRN84_24425 [Budvicia aquatica]VFS45153.1 Uncharacterised protein [Budvicia aquatica]
MEKHKAILQALANSSLGDFINESSDMDINIFEELYSSGMVTAIASRADDGKEYLDPKITLRGREFLTQLLAKPKESAWKVWFKTWWKAIVAVTVVLASITAFLASIATIAAYFK